MQVFSAAEIASFRTGGKILRACLEMLRPKAVPGVTTEDLDALAEAFIRDHGALPAFQGYNGYPATLCTSVNDECVHGIPGSRVLEEGDILSMDCGVLHDELYTDACITVPIGQVSKEAAHLLSVTEAALARALAVLRAGVRVGDLSAAIQEMIEAGGCHAVRSLTGHGLGRNLHQFPDIPNSGKKGTGAVFVAGTVVAIEPIVSLGSADVRQTGDGWTLVTNDGSLSAHSEHTVLVTENGCDIIA